MADSSKSYVAIDITNLTNDEFINLSVEIEKLAADYNADARLIEFEENPDTCEEYVYRSKL